MLGATEWLYRDVGLIAGVLARFVLWWHVASRRVRSKDRRAGENTGETSTGTRTRTVSEFEVQGECPSDKVSEPAMWREIRNKILQTEPTPENRDVPLLDLPVKYHTVISLCTFVTL